MDKIKELRKKMEEAPDNIETILELAYAYAEKGDYKKAAKYYKKAVEKDEKNGEAYYNLGVLYGRIALKDISVDELWEDKSDEEVAFNSAVNYYLKAIEIDKKNYHAYNNLGILYKAFDWHDKAKECFEKSLEINPEQENIKELLKDL